MEVVAAALVTAVPATLAALAAWRASRRTSRAIGTPNGKGDVVSMLEHLVEWKGAHVHEHAELQSRCPLFDHNN